MPYFTHKFSYLLDALQAVVAAAVPGKAVVELCELGDSVIQKATDGLFSKAKGEKKVHFKIEQAFIIM